MCIHDQGPRHPCVACDWISKKRSVRGGIPMTYTRNFRLSAHSCVHFMLAKLKRLLLDYKKLQHNPCKLVFQFVLSSQRNHWYFSWSRCSHHICRCTSLITDWPSEPAVCQKYQSTIRLFTLGKHGLHCTYNYNRSIESNICILHKTTRIATLIDVQHVKSKTCAVIINELFYKIVLL